jgi:hypothetical protein
MELLIAVVSSLIVAAILGAISWLRIEKQSPDDARVALPPPVVVARRAKRAGSGLVFASPHADECVRCGARR